MFFRKHADSVAWLLALLGLYWFASSFFLSKRSLGLASGCGEAHELLSDWLGLSDSEIAKLEKDGVVPGQAIPRNGCWMDRSVDSVVILVVDALRFDFALYNFPKSFERRLSHRGEIHENATSSKLFKFVADPPTVTVQRLKALTTGGLPTFADISGNFGGASVDEDSWVRLLNESDWRARGLSFPARAGFVGDDTWEDLYPGYFAESFPYPSFNTRDLDTVDNGCLHHLPHLLSNLRRTGNAANDMEVLVVHFLGVDHVGHTYGPHNEHMTRKLAEMDDALSDVLEVIDTSRACHSALIFGDHGMTEDGNHGGGTEEEINAALFVHSSAACRPNSSPETTQAMSGSLADGLFDSIHQIDLVPTLSFMLGLPVPYGNLGALVVSLLPGATTRHTAAAIALNAAQAWRYLRVYSETANNLPGLGELGEKLQLATMTYKEALEGEDEASLDQYTQATALYKVFLDDALDLGQRVWAKFDDTGMLVGIGIVTISVLAKLLLATTGARRVSRFSSDWFELCAAALAVIFQCGVLSFSNSYIYEEMHSSMFWITVISLAVAVRRRVAITTTHGPTLLSGVLLLPLAARSMELFVTGHGTDPSIRLHTAHSPIIFLSSLSLLVSSRCFLFVAGHVPSIVHCCVDCLTLLTLGVSWLTKRNQAPDLNGYFAARCALGCLGFGFLALAVQRKPPKLADDDFFKQKILAMTVKLLAMIMAVTGPATATSVLLFAFEASVLSSTRLASFAPLHPFVVAALWKLTIRHAFFATNHGCAFNRLQYSAAFVASHEFNFVLGGINLFANTFGWELVGLGLVCWNSHWSEHMRIWDFYCSFQMIEMLTSCISVSLLRRHLMVWDIYAPHFLFVGIFTVLTALAALWKNLLVNKPRSQA